MQKHLAPDLESEAPAPAVSAAPARDATEEPPPFLGTWKNVYTLVLAELAVLVAVFYVLTRWVS